MQANVFVISVLHRAGLRMDSCDSFIYGKSQSAVTYCTPSCDPVQ